MSFDELPEGLNEETIKGTNIKVVLDPNMEEGVVKLIYKKK